MCGTCVNFTGVCAMCVNVTCVYVILMCLLLFSVCYICVLSVCVVCDRWVVVHDVGAGDARHISGVGHNEVKGHGGVVI